MRALVLYLGLAWQQSVTPDVVKHVQAGLQAQKQGRLNDAIREFNAVTVLMPNLPAAFVNLGAAYMQDKNYGANVTGPWAYASTTDPLTITKNDNWGTYSDTYGTGPGGFRVIQLGAKIYF